MRRMVVMAGGTRSPMRFDDYMDAALYGDSGFYTSGGRPSARQRIGQARGDFATSVELGTLFARCIAGWLDRTWRELGRPDPFVVVEGGAGRGTLCLDVLAHVEATSAALGAALRYVMVERVAGLRHAAESRLAASSFPLAVAVPDLPSGPFVGVVIANELLDNLPLRLLERSHDGWQEIHVQLRTVGADEPAVEVMRPADADAAAMAAALAPDAAVGSRVPLQLRAAVWVRRALRLVRRGCVLVFDYGVPSTAELIARSHTEWLRTYRAHRRGLDVLRAPGTADITCDVAFDQLPPGATLSTQAEWLAAAGIDSMTAGARSCWQRSRAAPTADALGARALLDEAAALTDPSGMGAFTVAEWRID
ncbi:SAM-dependent methyltransferase [Candidatus Poriferisodalis sp.]|uniref:SAM-dependent methyltransferase n=1 Tax=Candidatus Poriferisodalis sp. TaxID=3101277 RepID=UPI003B019E68